jgi:RNA polymerase sigma-70 factor, ECF subfamily
MLRITRIADSGTGASLRVEGRITRPDAGELTAACAPHLAPGRTLLLDVSGVQFADGDGVSAIRTAVDQGTVLVGCSHFLQALLDDEPADDAARAERALVARLRAGDEAAYEEMVRAHGGRLLAVARRILGGHEQDARDAVQDGFISAFRSIHGFAGGSRLSTWLHRIVVNAALMKLRSRKRRPEDSIEDLLPSFGPDDHQQPPATPWREPFETLVERREVRSLVRECIDRLPEDYRTVLLLRDIEELDTEEAARVLGITPNAVKSRLHRARQALRTLLDPHLRESA